MLNLNDIIALAKQGYKPSDIKELIELSQTEEQTQPAPEQSQTEPEQPTADNVPETAPTEETQKEGNSSAPEVDYKKKVEELEAKLSALQKQNTKQNADKSENKKSDAEMFADTMRSFM